MTAPEPPPGRPVHPLVIPLACPFTLNIYFFVWLYKRYGELQRAEPTATSITPGRAVGFLFIPVFNAFWLLRLIYDLGRAVGRLQTARLKRPLLWPYTVTVLIFLAFLISNLTWFFSGPPDFADRVLAPETLVSWAWLILSQPFLYAGLMVAQVALNRVWYHAANPALPSEATWSFFRRQLFGSLICLVLLWGGLLLVLDQVILTRKFIPARAFRFELRVADTPEGAATDADVQMTISRLRQRLESYGVDSPLLERTANVQNGIAVVVPPYPEPDRLRGLLTFRGRLEFKEVLAGPFSTPYEAEGAASDGTEVLESRTELSSEYFVCRREPLLTGEAVRTARAQETNYGPVLRLRLTPAGGQRMREFSRTHIGKRLAIVLDGKLLSTPIIQSELGEDVQVAGQFEPPQARELALMLRAGGGALPRGVRIETEEAVSTNRWLLRQLIRTGLYVLVFVILLVIFFRVLPVQPKPLPR